MTHGTLRTLFCIGSLVTASCSGPPAIRSVRPLEELARQLSERSGEAISYEDPIWEWQGDLKLKGTDPNTPLAWYPAELTFRPSQSLGSADLKAVLEASIQDYNRQTDGPKFKLLSSRLAWHIVPDQVRTRSGLLEPAKNPLDVFVTTVAEDSRTISGHLRALAGALSIATGLQIKFSSTISALRLNGLEDAFGGNTREFRWGVTGATARTALIDLLERSEITLSWDFMCSGGAKLHNEPCYLSIVPVARASTAVRIIEGAKSQHGAA